MRLPMFFLSLLLFLSGCLSQRQNQASSLHDSEDGAGGPMDGYWAKNSPDLPQPPQCGAGRDLLMLKVTKIEPLPAVTPIEADPASPPTLNSPGDEWVPEMRIDLCADSNDQVELQQVVEKFAATSGPFGDSPASYLLAVPNPAGSLKNLTEAAFGNTAGLEILIPFGWGQTLKVVGPAHAEDGLIYFFTGSPNSDGALVESSFAVGKLEPGDPFVADTLQACPASTKLILSTQKVTTPRGKIELTFRLCQWSSQGTTRHIWKTVTVMDEGAPGEAAGKAFTFQNGAAAPGYDYKDGTVHHNACSSFVFTLPHATYAMTDLARPGNNGANISGCSAVVDGAPDIANVPIGQNSASVFSYTYGAKERLVLRDPPIEESEVELQ